MNILKFIIVSLAVLCSPSLLWAQSSIYTANLDSIVVTVGRQNSSIGLLPYTVNLVDSNSLAGSNSLLSIKEILNTIPGVNVSNRYNLSQDDKIIIRGIGSRAQFGTRGIKILLDDIPLTFPDGQTQLNNLDPGSLGIVEVLRGPSSSLYGNASGGVISISSDVLRYIRLQVRPEYNAGSFGFRKVGVAASSKLFNGAAGINIYTASYEGFRNHSESKFSGINFITSQQLNDKFNTTVIANYYNAPYLLNPSSLNKSDAENIPTKSRQFVINSGSGKEVEQFQSGLTMKYNFSNTSHIKTTLYGIWRALLNSIPNRVIDLDRFSYGLRSTFSFEPTSIFANSKVLIGFDYEVQDDSRTEYINSGLNNAASLKADEILKNINYGARLLNQNETVKSSGIFSQIELNPIENFILSTGVRYDYFIFEADDLFLSDNDDSRTRNMDKFSPSLAVSYKVSEQLITYSNYSTSFQTPTTNELSNTPDGAGGFNESLSPETIRSIEIGVRGKIKSMSLIYNAAYYKMFIDDIIISYENQFEETYYSNSGKTINNGLELLLQWQPHKIAATTISYTYQDFTFDDFISQTDDGTFELSGKKVPGVPKHLFNLRINSQLFYSFTSQININAQSEVFTNDFNGPPPGSSSDNKEFINDGYTTIGFRLTYSFDLSFGQININAGIENLFDKRYNSSIVPNAFGNNFFEPAEGRSFYGGIRLNLP